MTHSLLQRPDRNESRDTPRRGTESGQCACSVDSGHVEDLGQRPARCSWIIARRFGSGADTDHGLGQLGAADQAADDSAAAQHFGQMGQGTRREPGKCASEQDRGQHLAAAHQLVWGVTVGGQHKN